MLEQDYKFLNVGQAAGITINNTPWTKRQDGGLVIALEDAAEMIEVAEFLRATIGGSWGGYRKVSMNSTTSILESDATRVISTINDLANNPTYNSVWYHRGVDFYGRHTMLDTYRNGLIYETSATHDIRRALLTGAKEPFTQMTALGNPPAPLSLAIKTELADNAKRACLSTCILTSSSVLHMPVEAVSFPFSSAMSYSNVVPVRINYGTWEISGTPIAGVDNPNIGRILINTDSDWSDVSSTPICSYGSFGSFAVKMDSRSFVAQAGIVPYGAVLGALLRIDHGWYGAGIPTTNVDTTYVMVGVTATASGSGANTVWSVTMPSIADIVAKSGFTLRSPVDDGNTHKYGDVINISSVVNYGVGFDWMTNNQRHLSDFY